MSSEPMPSIERLLDIMARLRDPDSGCPWDLQQDHRTLIPFLIEESYEVIDAIETGEADEIRAELGDLLFQVVFHAQLGKEAGQFNFEQVAQGIADKLENRHPHVFGDTRYASDAEREAAWDQLKAQERAAKGTNNATEESSPSTLAGIARAQPALMRAQQLQRRAARVGFDWPDVTPVFPKIQEEIEEIQLALQQQEPQSRIEEEVGDLLFAVVNLARHLQVDAENALRLGSEKFTRRFNQVESRLATEDRQCKDVGLEQLETLWQAVKAQEK